MSEKSDIDPIKNPNIILSTLIRILLLLIIIQGFLGQNHEHIFIAFSTIVLTYYPSILEKKFGVYLPASFQVTLTLFIFGSQYLGEIKGFYDLIPWWDSILHATSGIMLGIIGFMFVYLLNEKGSKNIHLSPLFVVIFAFCFAITMGVIWEFFEFGMDRSSGTNMQKFRYEGQDGLLDTMVDLIVDSVGALVSCLGGWIYIQKKQDVLFRDYFKSWFKPSKSKNK